MNIESSQEALYQIDIFKMCSFGGTWAWRNNNPGNLVANPYTMGKERSSKAIGKAGGFATYPDYKTGHQALVDMLSGKKWGGKNTQTSFY